MLSFDDPRWDTLEGGYRKPYDPRPALARVEAGDAHAWAELWRELHHQGDVGEASYATVPHLARIVRATGRVDWNVFALAACIEVERHRGDNPGLPAWLQAGYEAALEELQAIALQHLPTTTDATTARSLRATIALSKGPRSVARQVLESAEEALSDLPVLTLDGSRVSTLDEFYDEVERVLTSPGKFWGRNLNAFNDILRGGFGTPDGGFTLIWRNSELSRVHLGPDLFDDLVEIICVHGPGGDEAEDNVILQLD